MEIKLLKGRTVTIHHSTQTENGYFNEDDEWIEEQSEWEKQEHPGVILHAFYDNDSNFRLLVLHTDRSIISWGIGYEKGDFVEAFFDEVETIKIREAVGHYGSNTKPLTRSELLDIEDEK